MMISRAGSLTHQFAAMLPNIPAQHRIPVLRHPNQVILAVPNGVAAALVLFHPASLHRKRRDPTPPKGVGFADPRSGTLNSRNAVCFELAALSVCKADERISERLHVILTWHIRQETFSWIHDGRQMRCNFSQQ
jgi:hypothetical protein